MNWGSYASGDGWEELDKLGSKLSLVIHCIVHYPAFNKPLFECKCGVVFPIYLLRGGDWKLIERKHKEESAMLGVRV